MPTRSIWAKGASPGSLAIALLLRRRPASGAGRRWSTTPSASKPATIRQPPTSKPTGEKTDGKPTSFFPDDGNHYLLARRQHLWLTANCWCSSCSRGPRIRRTRWDLTPTVGPRRWSTISNDSRTIGSCTGSKHRKTIWRARRFGEPRARRRPPGGVQRRQQGARGVSGPLARGRTRRQAISRGPSGGPVRSAVGSRKRSSTELPAPVMEGGQTEFTVIYSPSLQSLSAVSVRWISRVANRLANCASARPVPGRT